MVKQGRQGQSILEYAVLISVVIAAAIGMQTYVKRGVQGRYKAVTDDLANQGPRGPQQYEPYYAESQFTTETHQDSTEGYDQGGVVTRDIQRDEHTRHEGGFQQEGVDVNKETTWNATTGGGGP